MKKVLLTAFAAIVVLTFALPTFAADDDGVAAAKPKKRQFTGNVEAVDTAARTITVKSANGESKPFVCGPKCKFVTADKPAAEIADIKVGTKVTCAYTEEGGKNVCHRCSPPDAPKKALAPAAPAADKK